MLISLNPYTCKFLCTLIYKNRNAEISDLIRIEGTPSIRSLNVPLSNNNRLWPKMSPKFKLCFLQNQIQFTIIEQQKMLAELITINEFRTNFLKYHKYHHIIAHDLYYSHQINMDLY
jgi:hypothetical protein